MFRARSNLTKTQREARVFGAITGYSLALDSALQHTVPIHQRTARLYRKQLLGILNRMQPFDVSKEFFAGVSYGIGKLQEDLASADQKQRIVIGTTTAFEVYLQMFLHLDEMLRFKSTAELHKWLCAKLGEQRVGDLKRIQSICKRLGLSFRTRGRPKK